MVVERHIPWPTLGIPKCVRKEFLLFMLLDINASQIMLFLQPTTREELSTQHLVEATRFSLTCHLATRENSKLTWMAVHL